MSALARNKKAYHNYHILETFEAGMVLLGTEVKSIRESKVDIKESYIRINGAEAYLVGCHVQPYSHGNIANHEPTRAKKLLLHKKEIVRLIGKTQEKGFTLVPLTLYLKQGRIKLKLGLARGKDQRDKRDDLKKKEANREMARALKSSRE